ncbi:MAG: PspC domain-containing protein [Bacteroidales bacterium]|nr:PspC domain-containing protein [Bacteroidales bacterium]
MEKAIKINIAGVIFQISEDAYELLRDYLQSVSSRLRNIPGGSEMLDDIEARIAELFQSKPSWQTAVISRDEVDDIISTMGSPEDIAGDLESEPGDRAYYRQPKKLYRNTDNSIIGGVCSGIADYTGIDAVWIRIIFILFTIVYLTGALVYLILWIALPGSGSGTGRKTRASNAVTAETRPGTGKGGEGVTAVGNAFNEIFRAFGKFLIILFRIILAIVGVTFIIAGFSALFSFLLITLFHSTLLMPPFFNDSYFYLPHFLYFIADPALSVWLTILISLVVGLPLVALIYWGIRMTFQFRIRDLMLNLSMLIIWILSCVALSIIFFTQGVSFSESQRISEQMPLPSSDTIYVKLDDRVSSLDYRRAMHLPFEPVNMYLDEEKDIIYVSPELNIYSSDEDRAWLEIIKYSSSHSRNDALKKAEKLIYDVRTDNDTLKLDEYFTLPEGERWSGAFIKIRLHIPDDKVIYFDEEVEKLMHDNYFGCGIYSWEAGGRYWKMTEGKLKDTD